MFQASIVTIIVSSSYIFIIILPLPEGRAGKSGNLLTSDSLLPLYKRDFYY